MSSTMAPTSPPDTPLRKRKSLKQILIPSRNGKTQVQQKQPKHSETLKDDSLQTEVVEDVRQQPFTVQPVEPHSASSSQAPSSILTNRSSAGPSSSRRPSRQVDSDIAIGTEQLIESLHPAEARIPKRSRASTLTNFSKPYGLLPDKSSNLSPKAVRKTSHQALRSSAVDSDPKDLQRAFTDGAAIAGAHPQLLDPSTASNSRLHPHADRICSAPHPFKVRPKSPSAAQTPETTSRTWPTLQNDEIRGSTHSVQSFGSSLEDSKHSSTFTKISSNTETTADTELVDESRDGISVNDVIDFYADLEEEAENQVTPNTLEINNRSLQIAEAMTAPMGSLPTPGLVSNSVFSASLTVDQVKDLLHYPPSLQRPTATHDHYGFRKFSRDVTEANYNSWNSGYTKFQMRRNTKWHTLLTDHGLSTSNPTNFPPPSAKVQRYIRKGIPPAWRGEAWFFYSGAAKLLEANPDVYANLVIKSQTEALGKNDKEAVERDLHRTFPDNLHFKPESAAMSTQIIETPIMTALRRLLCAFAVEHPKIGYCQSLNFIAGLLLLFLPEEKAYWMLHCMTTQLLPGTHELSLEGANVDLWVLMLALKQANPGVWAKVGGDVGPSSSRLPPISLCTTSWFMSVFIGTLPTESVLRVWDVLLYEGSKTLFRIALAIFKSGEAQIKAVQDPMEIFQIVQTLPRRMVDIGQLFDIAFSRGEVGRRWIEKKRAERKDFYARERAVEKARRNSRDAALLRPTTSHTEDMRSPATVGMASPASPAYFGSRKDYWGKTSMGP